MKNLKFLFKDQIISKIVFLAILLLFELALACDPQKVPSQPSPSQSGPPSNSTSVSPSNSTPVSPSNSTSVSPSNSTPTSQSNSTPTSQSNSTPTSQSNSTPASPSNSTSVSPSNSTPTSQSNSTPASQSNSTPASQSKFNSKRNSKNLSNTTPNKDKKSNNLGTPSHTGLKTEGTKGTEALLKTAQSTPITKNPTEKEEIDPVVQDINITDNEQSEQGHSSLLTFFPEGSMLVDGVQRLKKTASQKIKELPGAETIFGFFKPKNLKDAQQVVNEQYQIQCSIDLINFVQKELTAFIIDLIKFKKDKKNLISSDINKKINQVKEKIAKKIFSVEDRLIEMSPSYQGKESKELIKMPIREAFKKMFIELHPFQWDQTSILPLELTQQLIQATLLSFQQFQCSMGEKNFTINIYEKTEIESISDLKLEDILTNCSNNLLSNVQSKDLHKLMIEIFDELQDSINIFRSIAKLYNSQKEVIYKMRCKGAEETLVKAIAEAEQIKKTNNEEVDLKLAKILLFKTAIITLKRYDQYLRSSSLPGYMKSPYSLKDKDQKTFKPQENQLGEKLNQYRLLKKYRKNLKSIIEEKMNEEVNEEIDKNPYAEIAPLIENRLLNNFSSIFQEEVKNIKIIKNEKNKKKCDDIIQFILEVSVEKIIKIIESKQIKDKNELFQNLIKRWGNSENNKVFFKDALPLKEMIKIMNNKLKKIS